ncbi:MAG TPA: NUDIX domain-containing protein [Thermomicrobiales bacterium]|nr:NUDIX domain-containing protein [Thermomicrobiales bacterium]
MRAEPAIHVCVGALLRAGEGECRILLGRRAPDRAFYPDVWDVPGGHCEPGEPPERTLVRELQEELGVTPTAWRRLATVEGPAQEHGQPLVLHLYVVTAWDGAPRNRQPAEHSAIGWFTIADACRLPLAHPDYPALFRRVAREVGRGGGAPAGAAPGA